MTEELGRRMDELGAFKQLTDETALQEFAWANRISWYILEPDSRVAWPASFLGSQEFQSGKYKVYHFIPPSSPMVSVTR